MAKLPDVFDNDKKESVYMGAPTPEDMLKLTPEAIRKQRDKIKAAAIGMGFEVAVGHEWVIQLDLDGGDTHGMGPKEYWETVTKSRLGKVNPMLQKCFGVHLSVGDLWLSKSGEGAHILLDIHTHDPVPLPLMTRSWIAMLFGSDPVRERLALMRHHMGGMAEPHLLFKPAASNAEPFDHPYGWSPDGIFTF